MEALERELATARDERSTARAELERLRSELDGDTVDDTAALALTTPAPLAPVAVDRWRGGFAMVAATVAVAVAWTTLALVVGAAAWMLPAVTICSVVAARLAARIPPRIPAKELERRWPTLPIAEDAYKELLALPRRSVVVRIAVTFVNQPSRGDREQLRKRLRNVGATSWDNRELTISSGLLRTGEGKGDAWTFAPELIRAYCATVFDALVPVHEHHPITAVWPRARSG